MVGAAPRVFISRPIPDEVAERIRRECTVDMWPASDPPPPLSEKIEDVDGVITYGHERLTAEAMDAAPRLRVVSVMGVGYDHVDAEAAGARGIAVGHTPGVLDETTADLTFALLMAAARRLIPAHDHVRAGRWTLFDPNILWGVDVHHATLGIVGMGRIGYQVARRARGFDMRVLYNRRTRQPEWERELGVEYAGLDDLLAESDFVSLQVPLTDETRHMIGAEQLARMKPTAILINVARGPVVDPEALYAALQAGEIAGAALDVTEPEPMRPDDPLIGLENVIVTPHVGSATVQTRMKMANMAADNLLAGLRGEALPHSVPGG